MDLYIIQSERRIKSPFQNYLFVSSWKCSFAVFLAVTRGVTVKSVYNIRVRSSTSNFWKQKVPTFNFFELEICCPSAYITDLISSMAQMEIFLWSYQGKKMPCQEKTHWPGPKLTLRLKPRSHANASKQEPYG